LHDKNLFGSSLSFTCLIALYVVFSTLVMIINLLMGADARGTRGQQRRDDYAV